MSNSRPAEAPLSGRTSMQTFVVLLACGTLVLFGSFSLLVSRGKLIVVATNARDADVRIDGRRGTSGDRSTAFARLPYGRHELRVTHQDYREAVQNLRVRPWTGRLHRVELERRMIRLTVTTRPGAQVFLNTALIGQANEAGVFFSDQVASGAYTVSVRLSGYQEWGRQLTLRNDTVEFEARLQITDERRAEAASLVQRARELFNARNYETALTTVEQAMALDPDDAGSRRLRDQIRETIRILQR